MAKNIQISYVFVSQPSQVLFTIQASSSDIDFDFTISANDITLIDDSWLNFEGEEDINGSWLFTTDAIFEESELKWSISAIGSSALATYQAGNFVFHYYDYDNKNWIDVPISTTATTIVLEEEDLSVYPALEGTAQHFHFIKDPNTTFGPIGKTNNVGILNSDCAFVMNGEEYLVETERLNILTGGSEIFQTNNECFTTIAEHFNSGDTEYIKDGETYYAKAGTWVDVDAYQDIEKWAEIQSKITLNTKSSVVSAAEFVETGENFKRIYPTYKMELGDMYEIENSEIIHDENGITCYEFIELGYAKNKQFDISKYKEPSDEYNIEGELTIKNSVVQPVGTVIMSLASSPEAGWRLCNGQSLSKTSYPELFAILGYEYGGSGDTFNLPDYVGRVPRGVPYTTSGLAWTAGDKYQGGTNNYLSHTHSFNNVGLANYTHYHNLNDVYVEHQHTTANLGYINYPNTAPYQFKGTADSSSDTYFLYSDYSGDNFGKYSSSTTNGTLTVTTTPSATTIYYSGTIGTYSNSNKVGNYPPSLAMNFFIFVGKE